MKHASNPGDDVEVLHPAPLLARGDRLVAGPGEIHCWPFELDVDPGTLARCARSLCPDEIARASRFAFPVHRDRFVVAHGVMRHLLARYLGMTASDVRFGVRAQGKPVVDVPPGRPLSFNLSHSENRAILAVSDGREVGIDLERARPDMDVLSLARSTFSAPECEILHRLPAGQREAAFFRYWVAKEAVLKGEGQGLALPVDGFEVVFGGDGEACVHPRGESRIRADWTLREMSLGPGWPVAVASPGRDWRVCLAG